MREKIINLLLNNNKLYSFDEIVKYFNITNDEEKNDVSFELCKMEEEYLITHNKEGFFQTYQFFNLFVGTLIVNKKGFGFVDSPLDIEDLFISKEGFSTALAGDFVLCGVKIKGNKAEGFVKRVIKRALTQISGKVREFHKKKFLITLSLYTFNDIIIDEKESIEFNNNDMVETKIIKFFDNGNILVKVVNIIKDNYRKDIYSILYNEGVSIDFSKECLEEAELLYDLDKEEGYKDYKDLTDKDIYTIDSVHTKDIDDAVRVEVLDNGNYLLGVYIADVSFYVRNESYIDKDALDRGTSIYPLDMVVPMLPEVLSNDLCSLNEGKVRRSMACEMEIDKTGELVDFNIFKALIKSKHKLAYENINKMFNGDELIKNDYLDIYDSLINASKLAEILRKKRVKDGSFFFEDNEVNFILNEDGSIKDIYNVERGISEKMIEEFMIAANCCVSEAMEFLDVPFMYRVHEGPKDEKLEKLLLKLPSLGYSNKVSDPEKIKYILMDILKNNDPNEEGIPFEEYNRRLIVSKEIIRSMSKAVYQETNVGHFGLAKKSYCHFTSPIRRYPDLMVHRLIKQFLLNSPDDSLLNPYNYYQSKVNFSAKQSSTLERKAEQIERDINKYKECEYMEKHIMDIYEGNISSITNFGIYVVLDNLIEGLSRYQDMRGYFTFDEVKQIAYSGKTVYHIGDRVEIRVMDADKINRIIDFKILRKVV